MLLVPASPPATLEEVEEILSARIAALDATPYRQAGDEIWQETDLPLVELVADSTLEAHLAYSVSVESTPVVDDGNASEGYVYVQARVVIVYLYRLRSDGQRTDTREGAIPAARDIMGAVMAPDPLWGRAMPIDIYQPQAMEGEFLPVRLLFDLALDIRYP